MRFGEVLAAIILSHLPSYPLVDDNPAGSTRFCKMSQLQSPALLSVLNKDDGPRVCQEEQLICARIFFMRPSLSHVHTDRAFAVCHPANADAIFQTIPKKCDGVAR